MTLPRAAALVAASAAAVVGIATPAHAESLITIDSPNGEEVASGVDVVVTGYNGSDTAGTLTIECGSGNRSAEADPGSFSVSIGALPGPDSCDIYDAGEGDWLATFTVAAPSPTVSEPAVNSDAFYPLVRDGYRDAVTFRWRQDRQGRATIQVVNSNGRTVRTASPSAWRGRNDWTWNGKKNDGSVVPEGRYRIKVSAGGNTVSAGVTVKTELVTRTFRVRKEGNAASSFSTRGNCYARRDSYYQVATLDCWGGRYAKANYRIGIPATAFDVHGAIDLNRTNLDICCDGRITKGWSRASSRRVVLWAKVTGWRATDVNYVRVVYKKKIRI